MAPAPTLTESIHDFERESKEEMRGTNMNKPRRKALQGIIDQLEELKGALEEILSEEEEYRDNMPENMQGGEKYEKVEEAVSNIDDAVSTIEDVISSIEAATE